MPLAVKRSDACHGRRQEAAAEVVGPLSVALCGGATKSEKEERGKYVL